MSAPAKATVLRALLPSNVSAKTDLGLGPLSKTESRDVTLSSEQLTTEAMVGRIKELSKLRDEILQVMRQLNLTREAGSSPAHQLDYNKEIETAREQLDDLRNQHQEIQGKIGLIQREIDDSKKRFAAVMEIFAAGFAQDQLESKAEDFRRVLGRLPAKKLEAAKKAMLSQIKDQVIMAVGNRKQDGFYILIAAPKDKASQALQTLLLYDFTPIEIPAYTSRNFESEIQTEEESFKVLSTELNELKLQLDGLHRRGAQTLNRKLDEILDTLMLLRGILKLGEGARASRIYLRLERVLPAETVTSLSKIGIIELEFSS